MRCQAHVPTEAPRRFINVLRDASVYLYIRLSAYPFICLSIYLLIYLSAYPSICLFVYPLIRLSAYHFPERSEGYVLPPALFPHLPEANDFFSGTLPVYTHTPCETTG